jgi:hypothetical protein
VALADGLCEAGLLSFEGNERFSVTSAGIDTFAGLGIDVDELSAAGRPLTRVCADWSEQSRHLAGSLGGALTTELLRRGWVLGREAGRIVDVSPEVLEELTARFGVDPDALSSWRDDQTAA